MTNLPFVLPKCSNPATSRIEVYSSVRSHVFGSLDASVYTCDEHLVESIANIRAAIFTPHSLPLDPDVRRTCGYVHVFPTGSLAGGGGHPRWCDQQDCGRRRQHASPPVSVDTNRPEAVILDVLLVQTLHPAAETQVALTAIDGPDVHQLVLSLGQARVLRYRLGNLLDAAKGDRR